MQKVERIRRQSRGSLVSVTLKNHAAVRVSAGHDVGGVFFSWLLHFMDKQQKVLYMDILMLRSHACEGAATCRKGQNLIFEIIDNYQIYSNLYQS